LPAVLTGIPNRKQMESSRYVATQTGRFHQLLRGRQQGRGSTPHRQRASIDKTVMPQCSR